MSLTTKALMSVATVFAGNELRRLIGSVEVDDLLQPMGLTRRRSHVGESMLFMGAGVVVGVAAAVVLSSTKKTNWLAWLSSEGKAAAEGIEAGVEDLAGVASDEKVARAPKKEKAWESQAPEGDNHHPETPNAVL